MEKNIIRDEFLCLPFGKETEKRLLTKLLTPLPDDSDGEVHPEQE
jgi:hypothetical protein